MRVRSGASSRDRATVSLPGSYPVRMEVRIFLPPFFSHERCTSNIDKKHHHPPFTAMGEKACSACGTAIKLKHTQVANRLKHKPPTLCYACLCRTKKKKTSRERKVEIAKKRQQEREALARGIAPP